MNTQDMPTEAGESKTRKRKSTRNPDHYYQRNATDFLDGTRELSLAARGAYNDIIDLMYIGDGSIKNCDFWIACTLHVKQKQWKAIRPHLFADPSKLFIGEDGRIHNPRVDEEFSKRAAQRLGKPSRASRRSLADVSGDSAGNVNEGKDNDLNGGGAKKQEPSTRELESKKVESESEKKKESSSRGSRLPTDWVLPDDLRQWAEINFSADRAAITEQADLFRDYWIAVPGSKGAKVDWPATWRNWLRKAKPLPATVMRRPANGDGPYTSPKVERARAFLREVGIGEEVAA